MSPKRPSLADTMRLAAQAEPPPLPPIVASPTRPEPSSLPLKSDASTKPTGFYAATRAGKKKVTAALDPTIHKQVTTEALLAEAISDLLKKHGINRSA